MKAAPRPAAEPGVLDLQVNGYAGVDFNRDGLTGEALHAACARLRADGVAGILATVITDAADRMAARLRTLVRLRERDPLARSVIAGVHIEGPFLSPAAGFRGAHPARHLRPATVDGALRLIDAAGGLARIVTLAPERDRGLAVTRALAARGVVVSAGHTDASLDLLRASLDAGLRMFTHLGNGCPALLPRHDNVVQRVLALAGRLWISFIADGVHVPCFALRNYLRAAGLARAVLVSDATAAAGLGPGRYTLGRRPVVVGPDGAAWSADRTHLVGSAVGLPRALAAAPRALGIPAGRLRPLAAEHPRRVLDGG